MNLNENFKASGKVKFTLTKADGTVQESYVKNLVVNVGLQFVCGRIMDSTVGSYSEMTHMAIGTATANPAAGDTILDDELARVAFSGVTVTEPSIEFAAFYGPGAGTGVISEAGIFNAVGTDNGTMLCRTRFPIITKEAGDSLAVNWIVTIAAQ